MFVSLGIAALIATTTFLFTHNCFIKSFQLIKRVDQVLLEWQLDFSYHKEYLIVLILTFTIPLMGVISELTIPNHQSRNFARRFCESICFGFGMVTRSYVFIFLSFGFNIIGRQFKNLNETLIKMGRRNGDIFNKELKESNVETLLKLKMVVKLHATLCIAAKNLNRSLQIPLLVNIFFNFMIMSFIIVGCSRGRLDPSVSYWEYFAHTASLQAPLIFVLSRAEEVNYEARRTCRLMSEFTYCYFHPKFNSEMKNFLLLTLHNKIRLKVCGCYPLNFSVITNHFEHCCTLIIFLLKMNK